MAINGRSRSALVNPVAFNIARAGARLIPFFSASLRKTGALYHAETRQYWTSAARAQW